MTLKQNPEAEQVRYRAGISKCKIMRSFTLLRMIRRGGSPGRGQPSPESFAPRNDRKGESLRSFLAMTGGVPRNDRVEGIASLRITVGDKILLI